MNSLSGIMSCEIVREQGRAIIIMDRFEGKPVSLIGFEEDASLSDFEIYENGWNYYCSLKEEIEKIKNEDGQ